MTGHDELGHDTPDLVGLLAGELSRDETVAAARHLEGCTACTRELAELAVAHAALRSSDRVSQLLAD
jgi:anti-sigma factor RsiW